MKKKNVLVVLIILWSVTTPTVNAQVELEEEKTIFFATNPMSPREINVQNIYRKSEHCRRLREEVRNSDHKNLLRKQNNYLLHCMNSKIYAIRHAFKALMQKMSRDLKRKNIQAEFVTYPYRNMLSPKSPIRGLMMDLNDNLALIIQKRIEIEKRQKNEKRKKDKSRGRKQINEENLDVFEETGETDDWEFEWNEQIRDLFEQVYLRLAPEGTLTVYGPNGLKTKRKSDLNVIFSHFYFIKSVKGSKVRKTIRFRLFLYDLDSYVGEDNDVHPIYIKQTSTSGYTKTAGGYNSAMSRQLKSILDEFASAR